MKYMGSKRSMLSNGLGEILTSEMPKSKRFVDLFSGSGSVACHVATSWELEVLACDLQHFAVAIAASVLSRDRRIEDDRLFKAWIRRARTWVESHPTLNDSNVIQKHLGSKKTSQLVQAARRLCAGETSGPIQSAYGGHYFSPLQALWIDGLRRTLPRDISARRVALAALIRVGSQCAAAPGHTAQPFQPNGKADPFLIAAWRRDPVARLAACFLSISGCIANRLGRAVVGDAIHVAGEIKGGDLAFIDPPYSAVQYSRFYHVLESITHGVDIQVDGAGRYPPESFRPRSDFSLKTQASSAMDDLLRVVAGNGARAILTFPSGQASNGLSGEIVLDLASQYFKVKHRYITGQFSTLGGNSVVRDARKRSNELVLTLYPR